MGTIAEFYDLETEKLIADGRKVALFTQHPGALGAFREARLREYLKEHVPARHTVAQGFVSYRDGLGDEIADLSSRQIDCLIYDKTNRAPLIETDDFACVMPHQVSAFVEVKSTLTIHREFNGKTGAPDPDHPHNHGGRGYRWGGTLVDALLNVSSAVRVMKKAERVRSTYFAGVLAYDGSSLDPLCDALVSGELQSQLSLGTLDEMPDCICVLTRGWWAFEAHPWDPEEGEDGPDRSLYNESQSLLLRTRGVQQGGGPLQLFTAYLSGGIDRASGVDTGIGGLRSGAGRKFIVDNTRFPLPSPGRG